VKADEPLPLNWEFAQDPHGSYQRLPSEGPISKVTFLGGVMAWLVTRYAKARQLHSDPRLGKDHYRALQLLPLGTTGLYITPLGLAQDHQPTGASSRRSRGRATHQSPPCTKPDTPLDASLRSDVPPSSGQLCDAAGGPTLLAQTTAHFVGQHPHLTIRRLSQATWPLSPHPRPAENDQDGSTAVLARCNRLK
jgi:hypothetical protein